MSSLKHPGAADCIHIECLFLVRSGISPDSNPSDLRPRNASDMGNPLLFTPNGQQMAANMLQTATVDSSQHHPTDPSHQFNGQISYMSNDASASQFTMYTDLLNSSDPSCMVMSTNEQQGNLTQCMVGSGTSIVNHNGQLMLVSQPQVPLQASAPVNQCHDQMNENQNQQTQSFEQIGNVTTISRQQFEEGVDSLAMLNGNHGSVVVEPDDASNIAPVSASEPSGGGNDLLQIECTDSNDCGVSLAQDTVASDSAKPVETQANGQEFFLANVSSAQPTMAMNSSGLYAEYASNSFDQHAEPSVASVAPVTTDSLTVQNTGNDGQHQGQRLILHNGQLLLVSSNQNMTPQGLGHQVNGGVICPDFSGGFNPSHSMTATNIPIQGATNTANTMFLNKPNQYGPQPVTFIPGQGPTLPPNLLQAPLASNQTVTVNTPQGPMIMHTLPSQPNEHPQALILPNGAIVPVVTQPNLLFPPQQCIPVTGSLLVPSVTPSHMAQGLVSNPGQNSLAAKLMDGKGQTFTLSANPHMQINTSMHQFSSMVPQVFSGIDSSKFSQAAPLQAVPAQGHLPLPSLQPGSAMSRPAISRSKKKPTSASAAVMRSPAMPQLQGSLMMTQNGQFILVPSNDGSMNPLPTASHAKPAQRVLMPKPMPKTEPLMPLPMPATHQIASMTAFTRPQMLTTSCASMTTPSFMAPLTISVPLTCAPAPIMCTTSNDLLAQAAESLFTVSPSHNQSELHATDSHQLLVSNSKTTTVDVLPQGDASGKPKKSKKKKNPKPKAASKEQEVVEHAMLNIGDEHNLNFFSPGGRPEEEKESDINDFADLIRMMPPTPAPAKAVEVSSSTEMPAVQESTCASVASETDKGNAAEASSGTLESTKNAESAAKKLPTVTSPNLLQLALEISGMEEEPSDEKVQQMMKSMIPSPKDKNHVSPVLSSPAALVPLEPSNGKGSELCAANNSLVEAIAVDNCRKTVVEESNPPEGSGGKKPSSPRKKKSQKSNPALAKDQESVSKTVPCHDSVTEPNKTQQTDPSTLQQCKDKELDVQPKNQSPALNMKTNSDENSVAVRTNDEQANASCLPSEPLTAVDLTNNREQDKPEKGHANHKEKRSGRSAKREKAKTTNTIEDENIRQNGKLDQLGSSLEMEESKEVKEQGSISRRGFALSNFLPAAYKPFDAQQTENPPPSKVVKKLRPLEDEPEKVKANTTESSQKVEEATQTVRKELKSKNHDDVDSEGRGKKRHKKTSDCLHEAIPETLTFNESDIFSIVDKVENMAAATQTEPKRKSHSRKHKAGCDREGPSSKRSRKSSDKHASVSASDAEKLEPVAPVATLSVTEKKPPAQSDHETETAKRNPMDVFSFEMNDDMAAFETDLKSFRTPTKKSGKSDSAEKSEVPNSAGANAEVLALKEKESHGRKSPLAVWSSEPVLPEADGASEYVFSGPPSSKPEPPANLPLPSHTSSFEVPLSKALPVTKVTEVETMASSSASKTVSSSDTGRCSLDEVVSKVQVTESIRGNSLCTSSNMLAPKESTTAMDVPYGKMTEESKKDCSLEVASSKFTASKAQHMNIASIAGSLTPKGVVTKLSSHAQRNKAEREQGTKDSTNVLQEVDKSQKNRKECESENRMTTPVVLPLASAEAPQKSATKETVTRETATKENENLHVSKVDKQKMPKDKEPSSKNDVHAKNDRFSHQDASAASNSSKHYLTTPPVLSQCAYNDTYQKSRTPSTLSSSSGGSASSELLPASRSGCSHKSGSMQSSGQSGISSKMASGYNSAGSTGGVERERKSWQEESRRRNDADYFPPSAPSCAVQNKNADPYSCSAIFPAEKAGMAHQPAESATNFSSNFGSHSQNPFYPQSAFGGLNQVSPCSGDSMTRGGMSSCSVDKRSSNAKTANQPSDTSGAMRRDMPKTNQHDNYFSSQLGSGQFLEPNASPVLSSMNRDKSACLGTSLASQTNSRQQVPNTSSTTGRNPSQNRSPSVAEHPSPYSALSGYHSAAVSSMATTMLHHPSSMSDYSRYPGNGQHSLGFDMFQSPGTQFNPNLPGLTFDPPPLNVFRDCSSASSQSNGVKKAAAKLTDPSPFDSAAKPSSVSRTPSHQPSNQSQSCKTSSNRSSTKSSSSSSKKSSKPPTSYGMETGMFDSRSVTPFIGLGSTGLSPSRTMPPDSLAYFPPPNLFGNTGRTLSNAKTLQHRDTPLPFSTGLFSPSRAAQNGLGLNFQTGFGMDHVHGSHIASSQVIPPPPSANAMPAHMHGFGFGNIFSDISGAAQRDPLSNMSPIKFTGSMDASTLHHHHHHQATSSMYNGRSQLSAHMLPDMGFNPFLGHQHPGFDARSIGTHFGSHGPAAGFGMFPMHNL